jgi:predicted TIM-barrel fold metal-dependent hydrolase
MSPRPSRIDLHAHYVPDFYRAALAAAGLSSPDGIPAVPSWDETTALQAMDALSVRTAMLSISSPGVHFGDKGKAVEMARLVNEEAVRLAERHPGRFGFFASLPAPEIEESVEELRYALDVLEADGIVLETNQRGMYLGDERLEPIYAEVAARTSVIFIHPTSPFGADEPSLGYPAPVLEFMFETTRSIADLILAGVLQRHPGLRVIVPHAGAALPVLVNRIDLLAPALSNGALVPEAREAMKQLHFDLAGAPVEELLRALLSVASPEKLHYGSDYPFTPLAACSALATRLENTPTLTDSLRDAIFHSNSVRLFPVLRAGTPQDGA